MSLVNFTPVPIEVIWSATDRQPRQVVVDGQDHEVREVVSVRDQRAAWPAAEGPRLTLVVAIADGQQAEVFFDPRQGRWFLDAWDVAA